MTSFRPLSDRVALTEIPREQIHETDLHLPERRLGRPVRGKVVAVGPGTLTDAGERVPVDVEVGDVVRFAKHSQEEIEVDGDELMVVRGKHIQAVLES